MKIRLDRLGDEPYTWQETLEVDPATLDRPELEALGPVACQGRITQRRITQGRAKGSKPGFWFRAHLAYEQTLACTRCLRPASLPTSFDVELLILVGQAQPPASDAARSGKERQLEQEELGVHHLSEPVLETEDLLVEQLQLNVPMNLICRQRCAGLCTTCGANLNEGACSCEEAVDPRWAALAALRGSDGRET
jgi:uncharacterized metal-binding protein YceD (DUF177 family)